MIHASTSRGVMESSVNEAYWRDRFHSAGRVEAITKKGKGSKKSSAGADDARSEMKAAAAPPAPPPAIADTAAVLIRPATEAIEIPDSVLYEWLD